MDEDFFTQCFDNVGWLTEGYTAYNKPVQLHPVSLFSNKCRKKLTKAR